MVLFAGLGGGLEELEVKTYTVESSDSCNQRPVHWIEWSLKVTMRGCSVGSKDSSILLLNLVLD